jgi:hypothetical protein
MIQDVPRTRRSGASFAQKRARSRAIVIGELFRLLKDDVRLQRVNKADLVFRADHFENSPVPAPTLRCAAAALERFATFNATFSRYCRKDAPSRVFMFIRSRPDPFDIEMDCVAAV